MKRLLEQRTFSTTNFFALSLITSIITLTWTGAHYLDKFIEKQDREYVLVLQISHKDTLQDARIQQNTDSIKALSFDQRNTKHDIAELIQAVNSLMPSNRVERYYTEQHTSKGLQFNSIKP